MNNALAQVDFGWFNKVVEGETNFVNVGIHGGGHYSIGGEVGTPLSPSTVGFANMRTFFFFFYDRREIYTPVRENQYSISTMQILIGSTGNGSLWTCPLAFVIFLAL